MLSQMRAGGEEEGMQSLWNRVLSHDTSVIAFARPRYFDSVMLRETTHCLVDDQKVRLGPMKIQ